MLGFNKPCIGNTPQEAPESREAHEDQGNHHAASSSSSGGSRSDWWRAAKQLKRDPPENLAQLALDALVRARMTWMMMGGRASR